MSWPRMLTGALWGLHQAPNLSHALCPLCCTFLYSASRVLRSLLHVKREPSLHLPRKTDSVNMHVRWIHLSANPTSSRVVKIRWWMWLTWEASRTDPRLVFSGPDPCRSPLLLLWHRPQAMRFCSLHYMRCQANCLPCTLWFWTGVWLWSSPCQLCPETHILPGSSQPPHPIQAAHRSAYATFGPARAAANVWWVVSWPGCFQVSEVIPYFTVIRWLVQ